MADSNPFYAVLTAMNQVDRRVYPKSYRPRCLVAYPYLLETTSTVLIMTKSSEFGVMEMG